MLAVVRRSDIGGSADRVRVSRNRSAARLTSSAPDRVTMTHMATGVFSASGKHLMNPALIEHAAERRKSIENRVADHITEFSGSMRFVYIHIIWFTCWIAFAVEPYPYGLLTMIVSLEAIFLSTFVMISQNRADAKREVLADQQWATVQDEDKQNQQLLDLSHQILELAKAVHAATGAAPVADADSLSAN
jgi:uncharacterized membrane protein